MIPRPGRRGQLPAAAVRCWQNEETIARLLVSTYSLLVDEPSFCTAVGFMAPRRPTDYHAVHCNAGPCIKGMEALLRSTVGEERQREAAILLAGLLLGSMFPEIYRTKRWRPGRLTRC
jgi:hypothetical protein